MNDVSPIRHRETINFSDNLRCRGYIRQNGIWLTERPAGAGRRACGRIAEPGAARRSSPSASQIRRPMPHVAVARTPAAQDAPITAGHDGLGAEAKKKPSSPDSVVAFPRRSRDMLRMIRRRIRKQRAALQRFSDSTKTIGRTVGRRLRAGDLFATPLSVCCSSRATVRLPFRRPQSPPAHTAGASLRLVRS